MSDILTQVQDCLDQLLTQMHAILHHTNTNAPPAIVPGQPLLSSWQEYSQAQQRAQQAHQPTQEGSTQQDTAQTQPPAPPSPEQFEADLHELSRDLVLKEQQIEFLITRLPGIGTGEKEQMERMMDLQAQLEAVEEERREAVREKERLVGVLEGRIVGVGALK